MAYFKINNIDYSHYVNSLKVSTTANYNAQTNAAGDSVIDFINSKRTIEAGIIPVDAAAMEALQEAISGFNVSITFRNPKTNALEVINCLIAENEADYYTIQDNKVMYKPFTLVFNEL